MRTRRRSTIERYLTRLYRFSRFDFDDFKQSSVVHCVHHCCGKTCPYAHRPSGVQKPRHSDFHNTCKEFAAAMASIIHPLLALLASVTRQQLLHQITYLLAENRMLRSKLPGLHPSWLKTDMDFAMHRTSNC